MEKLFIFTIFLISVSAQHCDKEENCPEINKLEINETKEPDINKHCDKDENCPEINKPEINKTKEPEINKQRSCQWAEPGKPSIVVRTTAGRLGNCLFGYLILLGYKVSN